MNPARDIDHFVADPVGRYIVGATFLVWSASPTLCGSAHWGRSSERDVRELTRVFEMARHPALRSFDVFMDNSAIEHVDWGALGVLSDYLRTRLPEWGGRIGKQAVVMPSGATAVVLAGVVPLLGPTYPMRFVSSRGAALEWLARDELPPLLEEVDRLVTEASGVAPVLRRLRAYLDDHLLDATVKEAARSLRRSARSLQRELRNAGSGFGAELARARLQRACAMLANSEEKVEAIARRVGCLTSSRLSALFRRELGETPLAYRARHRSRSAQQ